MKTINEPARKVPVGPTTSRNRPARVDKGRFLDAVKADPQTYRDWDGSGWTTVTDGKEDNMFSPCLRKPFDQAIDAGLMPADIQTLSGT